MKDEEILNNVEPILKEYYSTFLLVGFKADTGEISSIGCLGDMKDPSGEYKKLKPIHGKICRLVEKSNEEDS